MRQLRLMLRLRHDGVSAREIARTLGVARSTIQDNLGRARAAGIDWPLPAEWTDEAIELFWREFDKAPDLDARLGAIARLTELYLQRNQFDRLVARLERGSREAERQRDMTICLSAAYQAAGDLEPLGPVHHAKPLDPCAHHRDAAVIVGAVLDIDRTLDGAQVSGLICVNP